MTTDLNDLFAFVSVVRAGGFRDAARAGAVSASSLSEAVRRLETRLGVRLLNRTTRSVAATEAGARLFERLAPALSETLAALDVVNAFRDRPAGTLRLNVPGSAARLVLPAIVPPFLRAYPDIALEVIVEEGFVDVLAEGCDAGIRYDERLEQDMIAVPIGPRVQRFATAASPAYLDARGRPEHPRDLLSHACLRGRIRQRGDPRLGIRARRRNRSHQPGRTAVGAAGRRRHFAVDAAVAGLGVVQMFEGWLAPMLGSGTLEPVLKAWWQAFSGPFLYYPGGRHLPAPLRAFVDFIKT